MNLHPYSFRAATPVWEVGTAHDMNRTISFCTDLPAADGASVTVAAAASCEFILLVNGRFVAHGPARCAHGFFRVDEYDLTPYLTKGVNRVCLRVAGYNVNSFAYLDQPSFLCAEILSGDKVIAATGRDGFVCYGCDERVSRVQRYSFQRTFAETYNLAPGAFGYEYNPHTIKDTVPLETAEAGQFLCRDIPYNDEETVYPEQVFQRGKVTYSEKEHYFDDRAIVNIYDRFLGYPENELDYASHRELGKCDFAAPAPADESPEDITLDADTYADIVYPCNTTGIYEFDLESDGDGELFIVFDEILLDGHVKTFRLGLSNVISVKFQRGKYRLTCTMAHVMKYARLVAKGASVRVRGLHLYHIAYPASAITARFVGEDETMRRIYDAAVETFRANSVDIYMDCPSRERAGWLCDSFFTSRVEYVLTQKSLLERAFLQNFLLPDSFKYLPAGMLPMCYPSDHYDETFIPNWAMWYGVELCEYLGRTGDTAFIEDARPKMYALLDYFKPFENEFGLLEKLESWVFVEWSKANELLRDVSFATNMLYARLLVDLGGLYGDRDLIARGTALRATVAEMAMTESGFFCDNAYRVDGKLVLSGERTEACQYYAFFCDVATPESHPDLWETLVRSFGYDRKTTGLYPEIYPANAFIGNYLRLDLLDRYGLHEELYDNIKGYFAYMADTTGTLWEHDAPHASCNHGFASHVIHWMEHLGLLQHQ